MTQAGQDSALLRCRAVKVSSSTYITVMHTSVIVYTVVSVCKACTCYQHVITLDLTSKYYMYAYLCDSQYMLCKQGVTSILHADAHLMGSEVVKDAIEHWLKDEASSVRDAAVQLVGNYLTESESAMIQQQQHVADDSSSVQDYDESAAVQHKYIELLLDRLGDDGVLVRKCVIRTLKSWLRAHPKDKWRSYICCALIERASMVQVSYLYLKCLQ
jgi:HEAT repeat associated with sister chromatid cohesion